LAAILVAVLLPLYLRLFHYRPESKGLKTYGAAEVPDIKNLSPQAVATREHESSDWTLRQAMHTYQLWFLILAQFLYWGIGCYLILTHQVKFVEDVGYSGMFAVSVLAFYGIAMCVGQLSGMISDRIGREKAVILASVLAVSGLACLISVKDTSSPWLLYAYAVCFGYGAGLFGATVFAGAADLFHGKHYGTIAGLLLAGMGLGGAIGPWLGGYLYDTSGSYDTAFTVCMVCIALASLSFW
ncbi:unnamed protein product, partial [marine sediment metagenome]